MGSSTKRSAKRTRESVASNTHHEQPRDIKPDKGQVQERVDFKNDEDEVFVSEYDVVEGRLRERAGDTGSALDEDLWQLMRTIAGDEALTRYVVEYTAIDDENDDTVVFVQASNESNRFWRVATNRAMNEEYEAYDTKSDAYYEAFETLIQEYGHIVMLNDSQLDFFEDGEECRTVYVEEGCAKSGPFLEMSVNRF